VRISAILGGIGRYIPIIDVARAHAYVTSLHGGPLPIPPRMAETLEFPAIDCGQDQRRQDRIYNNL
jgi:hypothetical protein